MIFGKSKSLISLIPGLSVMDRYMITELIPPFLFGIGIFSSIGVTVGRVFYILREAVDGGLPISLVVQILLLSLPQFIAYALPTSILLATLLTYSRLSSDSEIIALRSSGVSTYRLVLPALVMSLLVTGITFIFNEQVVPAANYQGTNLLNKALNKQQPSFRENNILYPEYGEVTRPNGEKIRSLKRLFYADQFDGERMIGLTVLDWSQQGLNQIVTSESAEWNPSESTWKFFNGTIYLISPDASYRDILRFENQKLQLPRTPLDVAIRGRDYGEMNIAQVRENIEIERLSNNEGRLRKLMIRLQQKFALPFACLTFGLVGSALGNNPRRTNKATGFGICVIVVFTYYILIAVGDALGLSNYLPPLLAAWLPNLFGLSIGGWLLFKMAQ